MNENSCCVHFFLKFLHSVTAQVNHIPHLPLPQRRSLSKETFNEIQRRNVKATKLPQSSSERQLLCVFILLFLNGWLM